MIELDEDKVKIDEKSVLFSGTTQVIDPGYCSRVFETPLPLPKSLILSKMTRSPFLSTSSLIYAQHALFIYPSLTLKSFLTKANTSFHVFKSFSPCMTIPH